MSPQLDEVLRIAATALAGGALGWWFLADWAQRNRVGAVPERGSVAAASNRCSGGGIDALRSGASSSRRSAEPPGLPAEPTGVSAESPRSTGPPGRPRATGPPGAVRAGRALRAVAAVLTAGVWAALVWRLGLDPIVPAVLAFAAASTVLAIVDVLEQRLPNRVTGSAFVGVAALLAVASGVTGSWLALLGAALGAVGMFAGYLFVALASPAAMGMGDVKLAALIGLLLGWFGLEPWLIGLAAAFVLGGVVAVSALALRRVTLRGAVPFGPSMLAGAIVAVLAAG